MYFDEAHHVSELCGQDHVLHVKCTSFDPSGTNDSDCRCAVPADLGEEDLGLDDTGADIDDDWGLEDEEAEHQA